MLYTPVRKGHPFSQKTLYLPTEITKRTTIKHDIITLLQKVSFFYI